MSYANKLEKKAFRIDGVTLPICEDVEFSGRTYEWKESKADGFIKRTRPCWRTRLWTPEEPVTFDGEDGVNYHTPLYICIYPPLFEDEVWVIQTEGDTPEHCPSIAVNTTAVVSECRVIANVRHIIALFSQAQIQYDF